MGYVYLMKPIGHNVYKVGETIDIENRIDRMQKKKDYKLECIDYIEVEEDMQWRIEHDLHRLFERYRLASEWFALPDYVIEDFKTIAWDVEKEIRTRNERIAHLIEIGYYTTGGER